MRTRPPVLAALLLVCASLAGCAAPASDLAAARSGEDDAPALGPGGSVRWNGTPLEGGRSLPGTAAAYACWTDLACGEPPSGPCEAPACHRVPFHVDVPEGHWDANEGFLEVSVRWPTKVGARLHVRIEDEAGRVLAVGREAYVGATGMVATLEAPPPGAYVAVVLARAGATDHQGVAQVESRPRETGARDLLPDLVTLPPTDLTLETPDYVGASWFVLARHALVAQAMEGAGVRGCRVDEAAEAGARRCLRFSNAVGNVGEGPLEVRLPAAGAAEARFVQVVHASDGATREVEAGAAEWHATHAHWHNAAANQFRVHPYDREAGTRGEARGAGMKGGVCFADVGLVDLGLDLTGPARYSGWGCLDPRREGAWTMGLSPNWYDLYPLALSDQFVDLAGVPDGVYQLCSATNAEGTLLETDVTNNEACTAFRLAGETVEVLDPPPYHAMRGEPFPR